VVRPALNEAKIVLANHVTALAHGQAVAEQANVIPQALFAGGAQESDLPVHFVEHSKLSGTVAERRKTSGKRWRFEA